MLGLALGVSGINFYTQGLFVRPLQEEFDWTRSSLGTVSFLTTIAVVFSAPLAGSLVDRFGVRLTAMFSAGALAAGFLALGQMNGGFVLYASIQIAMTVLGLGTTAISYCRAINERFDAARGLALGLMLCGTGVGAVFAPMLVGKIIAAEGWRSAYFHMAAAVLCAIPLVFVALGPGGKIATTQAKGVAGGAAATVSTVALLRAPPFLRLLATFFILALGVSGFVMHLAPMLIDQGVTPTDAATIQAQLGLAVIVGRLIIGALVDYFFAPHVAAVALCATAGGYALLAVFGPLAAPFGAFAIGFALGAEVDLIGYLCARYFGMSDYGRRYGTLYGAFALGTGLSPLAIAVIAEHLGGYHTALAACAILVLSAAALLATAPRFKAQTESQPS
jgi:MFS family permease